ncbi:hypothetical protein MNBD_GAMMA24-1475 [hydrothermal vent metagenome]|uniref:Uncharacterized protein n=1 Tax=hydrothermal vent metagenome TaxID=652676 RepID=A0A3B1BD43_9ZZZZ
MKSKLMILPAIEANAIQLLRVPDDFEEQEVYRYVTGVIARVEEDNPDYGWDDIAIELEAYGFEIMDYILGPSLG